MFGTRSASSNVSTRVHRLRKTFCSRFVPTCRMNHCLDMSDSFASLEVRQGSADRARRERLPCLGASLLSSELIREGRGGSAGERTKKPQFPLLLVAR